jgi:hypothetical protein
MKSVGMATFSAPAAEVDIAVPPMAAGEAIAARLGKLCLQRGHETDAVRDIAMPGPIGIIRHLFEYERKIKFDPCSRGPACRAANADPAANARLFQGKIVLTLTGK